MVHDVALYLLLHPEFSPYWKLNQTREDILTPPTGQVLCGLLHDSPVLTQKGPLVLGDTSPKLEDAKAATKEPCQNQTWAGGFECLAVIANITCSFPCSQGRHYGQLTNTRCW